MSLWDVNLARGGPRASFTQQATDPGTDPASGPFVCLKVPVSWMPLVLGSLLQLTQPGSWNLTDPVALGDVLGRATKLLNLFASAGACPVYYFGKATITIPAGQSSATVNIPYPAPYAVAPIVLVASADRALHAWYANVALGSFDANLDADVPVIVDTTSDISWGSFG